MMTEMDIDAIKSAYVECATWADWPTDDAGNEAEGRLTAAAIAQLHADVDDFVADEETAELIADLDPGQVGHDFWLTRNRHGAGFWDRGLGEKGERLTVIAHAYGARYLYVTDGGDVEVG